MKAAKILLGRHTLRSSRPFHRPDRWWLLSAGMLMNFFVVVPLPWLHIMALPLTLLLPGFAILSLAFGRTLRADPIPAVALCLLLSVSSYALMALALNVASIRITQASTLAGADGLILFLIALDILKARHFTTIVSWSMPPREPIEPLLRRIPGKRPIAAEQGRSSPHGAHGSNRWSIGYIIGVVLSIGVLILTLRYTPKPEAAAFTQFYLAGSSARAGSIMDAPAGRILAVKVGITNHTHQAQSYEIQPVMEGGNRWPVRKVRLPVGHAWSGVLRGPVATSACLHRLSIQLRIPQSRTVVGSLILWVRSVSSTTILCAAAHG